MAIKKATQPSAQNSVLARSVIISCFMLTAILLSCLFLQDNFEKYLGKYADETVTGLMLVALWLVVSSMVRSVNGLTKSLPAWKLILGGVLTGLFSSILTLAFLIVFPQVAVSQNMGEVVNVSAGMIGFMTALSFIVSLISVINLRIPNRSVSSALEVLLIAGCIFFVIYLINR